MPNLKQFKTHEEYLEWYRAYRKKNIKKLRNYNREYNKKWRKEFGYTSEENYKKKYPEKKKAHRVLSYVIKMGIISRGVCEVCKKPKAQGHHDDYTKPLDVIWLCPIHHKDRHKKLKID